MAVTWTEAPVGVIVLAERLIQQYHEHLLDARVLFIMRSEAPVAVQAALPLETRQGGVAAVDVSKMPAAMEE